MRTSNMIDYRQFRLRKLNTSEFEHLKLLAYWPVFGFFFWMVERLWIRKTYFPMHCALDDAIPFCEYFLIPYLFWFVFLIGMHIYTLLFDVESFKKMMKFIIISYSVALLIYILFPNCQQLRPTEFAGDNPLTRFIAGFYRFDTNTNVCPSLHVIGSAAVMLCARTSKHFSTPGWRAIFAAITLLISISTVFLKQHSVIDILVALPICGVTYSHVYGANDKSTSVRRVCTEEDHSTV